jgi:hypothetical protein
MKTPNPLRVLLGLAFITTYGDAVAARGPLVAGPGAPGAVAVVELYTSEGCSSCPPADDVLAALQAAARAAGATVLTAGFHVDYWDALGWKDPDSDAAFTARQALRGGNRLYTPQMVVNGQASFVGSDRAQASDAVAAALMKPAEVRLEVGVRRASPAPGAHDGRLEVEVRLDAVPSAGHLVVALVEDALETAVPRGENAGRTLRHTSVVRGYTRVGARAHAVVRLPLLVSVATSRARVLAWVEEGDTLRVLGSASAAVPATAR